MQKRIAAWICSIPLLFNMQLQLKPTLVENKEIEQNKLQLLYARKHHKLSKEIIDKAKEEYKRLWDEKLRLMKLEDERIKAKENEVKKKEEKKSKEIKLKSNEIQEKSKTKTKSNEKKINVTWEVSHYCSCEICSGEWGTQTAMGTRVRSGIVAVPKEIPLGSTVYIDGLGIFRAEDRGGYIKKIGNVYRIDVYVNSHSEAMRRGRYKVNGYYISS